MWKGRPGGRLFCCAGINAPFVANCRFSAVLSRKARYSAGERRLCGPRTKKSSQLGAHTFMAEEVGFRSRCAAPTPPSQARSGETLLRRHRRLRLARFHLIGSNPTSWCRCAISKRKEPPSLGAHTFMAEEVGFRSRFAVPTPPSQARSGETLLRRHRRLRLTRFHLIGSNPTSWSRCVAPEPKRAPNWELMRSWRRK